MLDKYVQLYNYLLLCVFIHQLLGHRCKFLSRGYRSGWRAKGRLLIGWFTLSFWFGLAQVSSWTTAELLEAHVITKVLDVAVTNNVILAFTNL